MKTLKKKLTELNPARSPLLGISKEGVLALQKPSLFPLGFPRCFSSGGILKLAPRFILRFHVCGSEAAEVKKSGSEDEESTRIFRATEVEDGIITIMSC